MDFLIIIYIIFGLLPSLTWLFYYLSKDMHPEPKKMILKIFLWGAFITIPVFFVQMGLGSLLQSFNLDATTTNILYWFLVIGFSEEFFKYLVFKVKVTNSYHLDEPLDVMLYMVVAALGFAAIENILYLFAPSAQMSLSQVIDRTMIVALIRFIGSTFLHTLCSAVIGYAMATSFYKNKKRGITILLGILVAIFFHGLYDFSLMTADGYMKIIIPITIIITLAIIVFSGFNKLKTLKGVCKV